MKKFFKKYLVLIISLSVLTIALAVLNFVHIKYDVTSPACITEFNSLIEIENAYPQKGSFNTTSVYLNDHCNVLQYLLAKPSRSTIVEEESEVINTSSTQNYRSGVFQKNVSLDNALIVAYNAAGKHLEYTYEGIIIHTVAVYAPIELKAGDVISKVNGKSFTSSAQFLKLYNEARLSDEFFDREKGICNLPLTINGKDVILTTDYLLTDSNGDKYPVYGFYYYDCYNLDAENSSPHYAIKEQKTTGPSGGLLQALTIFNALTEFDYTYGLKIGGTGTIDADGNVGMIGGMTSKIFTAYHSGIKIFFVPYVESDNPETNYNEAMAAYKTLGSPKDFTIVPVETFQDALDFLIKYGEEHA